jgi:transposase
LRSIVLASSRASPWLHRLSPPHPSLSCAAGRLQPSPPPLPCASRPCRHYPRRHSRLLSPGQPSVSRGNHWRCAPTGNQWHRRHCTASRRLFAVPKALADAAVPSLGTVTSPSTLATPRFRLEAAARRCRAGFSILVVDVSFGRPFHPACAPANVATTTSDITAASRRCRPWLRLPFS